MSKVIKIDVSNVFVDLQQTVTDDASQNNYVSDPDMKGNYFGGILRDLLVKKFKFSPSNALKKIRDATKPCGWIDPFYAASHYSLGISEEEMWKEVLKWQDEHLIIFDDAVYMIKELCKRMFSIYMVSNCPRSAILSQLTTAKLAKRNSSLYFKGIYGSVDLGLSKDNPLCYKKILEAGNFNPEKVVMIGDEPGIDLESPRKAGIRYSIIVDRRQEDKMFSKDGGIFVNSLRTVPQILK